MVSNATIEQFNNEAFTAMQQSNNNLPQINPTTEKERITSFIKSVLEKQGFKKVIIDLSGGIDSTTSFYLLKEAIAPENIFVAHLYYQNSQLNELIPILRDAKIPKNNIYEISINPLVKAFQSVIPSESRPVGRSRGISFNPNSVEQDPSTLPIKSGLVEMTEDRVRLGNIMARIRMIILYDLAKKHNALVCGTENKSEYLLGYFTRFGDEASDFEPIRHLYKTQVYELARLLSIPQKIINKTPTAGLWLGQTDEKEYGFTYKEADQVLYYYYDKKVKIEKIVNMGFKNTNKIIDFVIKNSYKHKTPYLLDGR